MAAKFVYKPYVSYTSPAAEAANTNDEARALAISSDDTKQILEFRHCVYVELSAKGKTLQELVHESQALQDTPAFRKFKETVDNVLALVHAAGTLSNTTQGGNEGKPMPEFSSMLQLRGGKAYFELLECYDAKGMPKNVELLLLSLLSQFEANKLQKNFQPTFNVLLNDKTHGFDYGIGYRTAPITAENKFDKLPTAAVLRHRRAQLAG